MRLIRAFHARFPYGLVAQPLNLAAGGNSPVHYAKGTQSPLPLRAQGYYHLQIHGFRYFSFPQKGFFSSFSRLTCSLSVMMQCLALESGLPCFTRSSTSTALLWQADRNGGLTGTHTGLSPAVVGLSRPFCCCSLCNSSRLPQPRSEDRFGLYPPSLAATDGVSVDFFSCGYQDVSIPHVRSSRPIHSAVRDVIWLPSDDGFPHSDIPGSKPVWRLP
eukprot:TRINITY_DN3796_c0_g6_i1.p1 TRINITY_DN3796_c0_g6~~TRINITY_DN3796_c0_g6_i1.p1  ORF type:complete len:217 (+),score=-99.50 TRINITY_DN3796_c0_g6_i1:3-653(+)